MDEPKLDDGLLASRSKDIAETYNRPQTSLKSSNHLPAQVKHEAGFINKCWVWEVSAWMTSLLALGAIISVLAVYNNKPLPRWPYSITINSLVSVFSTICHACMAVPLTEGLSQLKWLWFHRQHMMMDMELFDLASRGPLGALQLMIRLRRPNLAFLGSFIILVGLATGPFTQQVVSYPYRSVIAENSIATIPIAQNYTRFSDGESFPALWGLLANYGQGPIRALKDVDLTMKAAVYSAVFGSDPSTFALTPTCSTGNCTWPDGYYSLAVCNECANITNHISKSCGHGSTGCNYTLPTNLSLFVTTEDQSDLITAKAGLPLIALNNSTGGAINTFSIIYAQDETHTLQEPSALECVLSYCAQRYTADVTDGTFTELVVDTFYADVPVVAGGSHNYILDPPPFFLEDTPQRFQNLSVFHISTDAIGAWLPKLLSGRGNSMIPYEAGYTSDEMQAFFQAPNISVVFDNIARAMTSNFRQKWVVPEFPGYAGGSPTQGIAWRTETYVRVNWAWLILPIALEALTGVFLVATVARSWKARMVAWKSSVLALMLHGVPDQDLDRVFGGKDLVQVGEMDDVAKKVAIRLAPGIEGEGLRLRVT